MPKRRMGQDISEDEEMLLGDGSVDEAIKELEKKYGHSVVRRASKVPKVERLATGIEALDRILLGGWPKGRISELWGPQSAGKSSLVYKTIAACQKKKDAKIAYFDQENTYEEDWARKCGVDPDRLEHIAALAAEDVELLLLRMIRQKWDMVIIDSVVEMLSEKDLKRASTDPKVGALATVLSNLLPKIVVLQSVSPTVVLLVNQVRDKIGFFMGSGKKAPGGNVLYHLDTIRLEVKRKEFIYDKKGKKRLGYIGALKVVKSKVSPEQEECRFFVSFKKGLVDTQEEVETK